MWFEFISGIEMNLFEEEEARFFDCNVSTTSESGIDSMDGTEYAEDTIDPMGGVE